MKKKCETNTKKEELASRMNGIKKINRQLTKLGRI